MIAYVDGGARGRRGPAGVGVVIEHPTGNRTEISECISTCDNNYAEYAALLIALQFAATYWFYIYVVWFLPLVLVALIGHDLEPGRPAPPEAAPARSRPRAMAASTG